MPVPLTATERTAIASLLSRRQEADVDVERATASLAAATKRRDEVVGTIDEVRREAAERAGVALSACEVAAEGEKGWEWLSLAEANARAKAERDAAEAAAKTTKGKPGK